MFRVRLIIIVGVFLLSQLCAWAQSNEGQDFWFGFMEHVDPFSNSKVVMITSKTNTTGEVRVPLRNWSQTFAVTANEVTLVRLPTFTETMGSETITDTGIEVVSGAPISVYIHQYAGARSEAAAVLPVATLGREYYALTYQGILQRGEDYPSEMLIVAIEDETNIDLTLSTNTLKGRTKGSKISITLDRGETYQVQGRTAEDDISGTYILGDKDFALFAGAVWTEVPTGCAARDNLLEQMYPVSTWGRQYITAPSHGVSFDVFRVLASEDNTNVEISNGTSYSLQAGEFAEYRIAKQSAFIQANKPIILAQYNIGQTCNGYGIGDPSLVLLNSIEQTRDTVTLFNSNFQDIEENYINIITRTADTSVIKLDGQKIAQRDFKAVNGKSDFSYAVLNVSAGRHTLTTDGCGVLATAYGYGNFESYSYGGGASFTKLNANPIPPGGCLSDTILFDSGLSSFRYSFLWDLGDGTTSTESSFTHQYDTLGSYDLTLYLHDQCLDIFDTAYQTLEITLRQGLQVFPNVKICEADSLKLGALDLDKADYEWNGPNGFFSKDQFPTVANVPLELDGMYEVIGIVSGCATHPRTVDVELVPLPHPNLGSDTIVCELVGAIELDPGIFTSYLWQDGRVHPNLTTDQEGVYTVEVRNDFGCSDTSSIILTQRCPTRLYVPNAFTPNGDMVNDQFQIFSEDLVSIRWRVFNRWGNLIFESNDPDAAWDGTMGGERLPTGVYLWTASFEGYNEKGEMFSDVDGGVVHLLR